MFSGDSMISFLIVASGYGLTDAPRDIIRNIRRSELCAVPP